MKKLFLTLTMLLFAFTGVMRASAEQGNVRADQVIEQGFEDGMGDWTMNHCHSSSGPSSAYGGNTGSYAFRFYYTANYPQYLISPELDDNDGVNLTFYAARYNSNYSETFKVGYSSTTNEPTEFTWDSEVTCTTMYGAGAYEEYSYDFPAGTKYVSIACTSNDQFYLFVDDITVTATEPAPAPTPGGIVEVTIGDPTSTTVSSNIPGYSLYEYSISQQIYTADEIGVAGTINTLTMWLKNSSSYARNINVYMKEVEATEFASATAWESFTAADMVVSFTMPNENSTTIEVALPLDNPFVYSGTNSLAICFQDVTGSWSSGLGGVVMDAAGNQAIYAYRDGTVYDPSNPGENGTLLAKKNVIRLSIMTGGGASTAFSTTPDVLDLGYRPNGAWMAPYVFNMKSNVGAVTVNALDFSGNYFTYNAELPATVSGSNPLEVAVSTGTAEAGEVNSTITVLYSGNDRDAEQITIKATAYDPVEGDVWENAIEVPAMEPRTPYETELPEMLYKNYDLPDGTEYTDAVYKMTFDQDVLLFAGASSDNASAFLYTENFEGEGGPMADNNYEYNGPQVNPGPTALWFSYPYTGTNTWYGTSAGGGFYFGYKISTDLIAANDLAGLTITTVEAAAREAYPYYCYIIEGGATPDDGELIGYGEILNTTALYFFDINLEEPAYISGNDDIWVIFYSDSPYAAYCGRYPVSTADGKIWTYNPNASSPAWSSNVNYTPVIYARMLELPTGREVTMDLASMTMPKGNGVVSEVAEAEGEVMNVAKAQLRNRDVQTLTVHDGTETNGNVPFHGFYGDAYLKCEMVYPAAELADMAGGTINSMTFYASETSVSWGNANQQVFVTEVADASISEFAGPGTVVFEGALSIVNGEMVVNFTTPYTYNGGNLLVGVYNIAEGSYVTSTWYGETVSGASVQNYNYNSLSAITPIQKNFLPKTTFAYEAAGGGGGDEPTPYEPYEPGFATQIDGMYVPAGTYYAVFASDVVRDVVNMAYAEVPAPDPAIIVAPTAGELVEEPYLAEWVLGNYTEEFQVLCGTQYPPTTVMIDWTDYLVPSAFLTNLENNKNYFLQVNARNAAGETKSEVVGFHTAIDPVEGFAVVNDSLYPGDAAEFSWEANSRTLIGYNLYKDGELVNVEGPITGTEYAVEDLEYNMAGYAFQITAVYGAGESVKSDPIIVKMTGTGTISGHVYDAPNGYDPEDPDQSHPVANLPVFIIVQDEYGQVHSDYEAFTDENGFYTAEVLTGIAIPGISYQTAQDYGYAQAASVQSVANVSYQDVIEGMDIYTHEYYYPLGMITATEQTDENNVLVEWDWNPAELVVDFETGDFSQAEFTLPAQYAWAVTTTNPHEGTYCMKSTCEGIASATSSIEVTVEVPYDGLMGFWVRVSSESNYDKFHFYIDGVEQGAAMSGELSYQYKEYAVTAGTHTYKWEYTKDSSVNNNDDCVYVDDIKLYCQPAPPIPGATVYDFEDQTMMGWTSLDANNDGYGWVSSADPGQYHSAGVTLAGSGHNASQGFVLSGSYSNSAGIAITPDNYLVSPTQISVEDGALISFYACAQDAGYPAEHFGVAVSTSTATAANFTMVQEWTMTSKGIAPAEDSKFRGGNRAQGNWYEYSVDLSSYAGQDIWVAIRHFNCNDQFILNVDDITLADGSAKQMARNERTFQSFNLYRRDIKNGENDAEVELIATPAADVFSYIDNEWSTLDYGMWQWGIQATYEGYAVEETGDREVFTYTFDNGLEGWTNIDADGDGNIWYNSANSVAISGYDYSTLGHNGTGCFMVSQSYTDLTYDSFDADNYLVSPQKYPIDANSSITFWQDYANDSYPDFYEVMVSTAANPGANDFTSIWSVGSKGNTGDGAKIRNTNSRYENWTEYTVSLAAYAGQEVWIAFHHEDYDNYELWLDDVTVTAAGSAPVPPTPTPTGSGLSEILWSNVIDKDMIADVTVNVTLNNAQLPVGAVVTFADTINDQNYTATTDATGMVNFDNFRKGNYIFNVALEGYELEENFEHDVTIDEDEMTFDVVLYEIIAPVANLYVSPTGWAMWEGGTAGGGTTPVGPTGNTSFTEDFEGGLNGWQVLTVNADGGDWIHSDDNLGGYDYTTLAHGGTGFAMCYSFVDNDGPYDTDSYLYTPQKYDIVDGSTLTFFADNANDSYPENFSVCVATVDNPTAADFTQVWSGGAKGEGGHDAVRHINNRYQNWRSHSIDLSAYAGQSVYIAFHDVNYDAYEIWIDDVALTAGTKGDRVAMSYKVKLDGKYEGETVNPYFQHNVDGFAEGSEHTTEVCAVYATGVSDWAEYTWTYSECSNYAGTASHTVTAEDNDVTVTWTLGDQPGPGPTPPGTGDEFSESFENGIPSTWNTIDADGDGHNWTLASVLMAGYSITPHSGSDMICSQSYDGSAGPLNPNNYLVTPQVTLVNGSTFSFWAAAQDASYAAEHFGVGVSDDGTNFTMVQEWTLTAKEGPKGSRGMNAMGNYYQYTVDLSAYAGQKYIAIRHFNCTDMFYIDVDDVELSVGTKGGRAVVYEPHFVTDPGAMSNGADASWTKNGQSTWGPNCNDGANYKIADDFTLDAATTITEIEVYGYQTGSTTTSTFTGLYAQIYDGAPNAGGQVVWGDAAANIMTATSFTNCYRGSDGTPTATTRPIMAVTATGLNIQLEAGTYYLVWSLAGTSSSGPWAQPEALPNVGNTGNGLQLSSSGWTTLMDSGASTPYGAAFKLVGEGGGPTPGPTPSGDVLGVYVFRDGELVSGETPLTTTTFVDNDVEAGEHDYCVRVVYSDYAMSCEECETVEIGEVSCDPVTNLTAELYNYEGNDGALVDWTAPAGVVSYKIYVNGTLLGSLASNPVFINFMGSADDVYEIGVVAVYAECESEMATVSFTWDAVAENEIVNNIYPNPTSGNVTIEATGMNHITVANALGQVVYDADVNADQIELNLGQYNNGLYLVRISTVNGVSVKRVTVAK